MPKSTPINYLKDFDDLTFLRNRTPKTTDAEAAPAFKTLSDYRDGGLFIGHFAGKSEWERHRQGDEIVQVIEGSTTLVLLQDGSEHQFFLRQGQIMVIPQSTWHRFESLQGVKILTVTPQPTDHSESWPE
ncbi:cupin domain-containing protein [Parasalinivibrio latis]|uniref:cupin domain-containing protein n=1 Tax=Parasalinivibrio latis TaxID=2952610 RepID=UPI0030DFF5B8